LALAAPDPLRPLRRIRENLYGRYWGLQRNCPGLHFEVLPTNQGIDYYLPAHGSQSSNPGAQGEHSWRAVFCDDTRSFHYLCRFRASASPSAMRSTLGVAFND